MSLFDEILSELRPAPEGRLELAPSVVARAREQALAYTDGEALFELLQQVVGLASFLIERRDSEDAARILLQLVQDLHPRLASLAAAESGIASSQVAALVEQAAKTHEALGQTPADRATHKAMSTPRFTGVGLRGGGRGHKGGKQSR